MTEYCASVYVRVRANTLTTTNEQRHDKTQQREDNVCVRHFNACVPQCVVADQQRLAERVHPHGHEHQRRECRHERHCHRQIGIATQQ